jgi:hypothetical protein
MQNLKMAALGTFGCTLLACAISLQSANAANPCHCIGYNGPGGPCYDGPGGDAYGGPGGPAYAGPWGAVLCGTGRRSIYRARRASIFGARRTHVQRARRASLRWPRRPSLFGSRRPLFSRPRRSLLRGTRRRWILSECLPVNLRRGSQLFKPIENSDVALFGNVVGDSVAGQHGC